MNIEARLEQLAAEVRDLRDRQEITACILRYTRGVDRMDEGLIRSAFHDDAVDFHDGVALSPTAFVAWYRDRQQIRLSSGHGVSNMTIELEGDVAHCETYYLAALRNHDDEAVNVYGGRYVDRLERRSGVWRIAVRVSIPEWHARDGGGTPATNHDAYLGSRDRSDISYARPLQKRAPPYT